MQWGIFFVAAVLHVLNKHGVSQDPMFHQHPVFFEQAVSRSYPPMRSTAHADRAHLPRRRAAHAQAGFPLSRGALLLLQPLSVLLVP